MLDILQGVSRRDVWAESVLFNRTFPGPVLTYFAASQPLGFAVPMLIATTGAAIAFVVTLLFSPKGQGAGSATYLATVSGRVTATAAVFVRPRFTPCEVMIIAPEAVRGTTRVSRHGGAEK